VAPAPGGSSWTAGRIIALAVGSVLLQSPGANRSTSPMCPSTWMVMAPNHSTKLALCTLSSNGKGTRRT
jgi:hypothetical protein